MNSSLSDITNLKDSLNGFLTENELIEMSKLVNSSSAPSTSSIPNSASDSLLSILKDGFKNQDLSNPPINPLDQVPKTPNMSNPLTTLFPSPKSSDSMGFENDFSRLSPFNSRLPKDIDSIFGTNTGQGNPNKIIIITDSPDSLMRINSDRDSIFRNSIFGDKSSKCNIKKIVIIGLGLILAYLFYNMYKDKIKKFFGIDSDKEDNEENKEKEIEIILEEGMINKNKKNKSGVIEIVSD